jgi:tetratricopeptide (TPR) repeat protein
VGQRVALCCDLAREYEDRGEYEEAREILRGLWPRAEQRPNLTDLDQTTVAEVLLRAGVLTGLIGSKNQIPEAQEAAKNLISESLSEFESRRYQKKIAEAQSELAMCYWRAGELNEARDLLDAALSLLTIESELRARTIVRLAIVERGATNFDIALRVLTDNEPLFQKVHNEMVKGSYHFTLGTVLVNLWESKRRGDYLDRALIEYAAASYHYELAEHRTYLANVENELGLIYYNINRCDEAHEHLDRARRILVRLKDYGLLAQIDETRACVYLKQGRIEEAEHAARSAVRRLDKGDRPGALIEAVITHGRALARIGSHSIALDAFRRAFYLAEGIENTKWAADAALAAFQEIGDRLTVVESENLLRPLRDRKHMRSVEHEVIKDALEKSKGSVTYAARSIGVSYQALSYMLNTRHKDLLNLREPPRRRRRKQ